MSNESNTLTKYEDVHPDKQLAQQIAKGEVSQAEVEKVWAATQYLSAQTPFEVRKMIVDLKKGGITVDGANQVILSAVLDLRAALYRDESKFAHLVAGTETIVATLQSLNPLMRKLDRAAELGDSMSDSVDRLEAKFNELLAMRSKSWIRRIADWFARSRRTVSEYAPNLGDAPIPEEKYDACIGSSWDKSNPRKAPAPVAEASATAKDAEARWDSFREGIVKKL